MEEEEEEDVQPNEYGEEDENEEDDDEVNSYSFTHFFEFVMFFLWKRVKHLFI